MNEDNNNPSLKAVAEAAYFAALNQGYSVEAACFIADEAVRAYKEECEKE